MLLVQFEQQYIVEKCGFKSTQLDFRDSKTDVGYESKITFFKKNKKNIMSQSKSNTTNIKVHTKHEIHVFAYNTSGQLRNTETLVVLLC